MASSFVFVFVDFVHFVVTSHRSTAHNHGQKTIAPRKTTDWRRRHARETRPGDRPASPPFAGKASDCTLSPPLVAFFVSLGNDQRQSASGSG